MSEEKKTGAPLTSVARIKLAEHDFTHHSVTAELGTTVEDLLDPKYLAHFAARFKPYDEITVRVDDGTFYAKLLVLSVGRSWVRTHLLTHVKLTTSDIDQTAAAWADKFDVIWRGPVKKFSVVAKDEKRTVEKDGFATKGEAAAWAAENA